MEEKTNKHTHEFVEVLLGGRYVPKNAESLSTKNKKLYGYTIMPSWVHLQMQGNSYISPKEKCVPARLTGWPNENTSRKARWSASVLLGYTINSLCSRLNDFQRTYFRTHKFIFNNKKRSVKIMNFLAYITNIHFVSLICMNSENQPVAKSN